MRLLRSFEALPTGRKSEYREPSGAETLEAYLAGKQPPAYPGKRAWVATVKAAKDARKVMQRVHAVAEPLTGAQPGAHRAARSCQFRMTVNLIASVRRISARPAWRSMALPALTA